MVRNHDNHARIHRKLGLTAALTGFVLPLLSSAVLSDGGNDAGAKNNPPRAELGQVALKPPAAILTDKGDALVVGIDQPIRMEITAADLDLSTHVLSQILVRDGSGQHTIHPKANVAPLRLRKAGAALVAASLAPTPADGGDPAWNAATHCLKFVVRVGGGRIAERQGVMSLTAKVGQRFEIVPLTPPTLLRPGADLPIRAFTDYVKAEQTAIRAVSPDGSVQSYVTDSVGAAHIRIGSPGRWVIIHTGIHEGSVFRADLIFDVLDQEAAGVGKDGTDP